MSQPTPERRIVALGGIAEGTLSAVTKRTGLADYPLTLADGREHLEALRGALAKLALGVRQGIDEAAQAPDADTADLLTEVSRAADKNLWFIAAHLQSVR